MKHVPYRTESGQLELVLGEDGLWHYRGCMVCGQGFENLFFGQCPGVWTGRREDAPATEDAVAMHGQGDHDDSYGPVQPKCITSNKKRPDELLVDNAQLFRERNALYGSNYLRFPRALLALFPGGIIPAITNEGDASRLQIVIQILNKLTRYAEMLTRGGHKDSARDIQVYAAMLEEQTK